MKYEAFVRAIDSDGRWGCANIVDLTDESFRRFVVRKMVEAEMVVAMSDDDDEQPYSSRVPHDESTP